MHHIIVGHGLPVSFHATTQHSLTDKIHSPYYEYGEDHADDGADGVGRWRRWFLCGIASLLV